MDFCASCRLLDIRLQSFLSHPGADHHERLGDPIRCLGRLNEIRNRYKTCHLCRLVFAIFDSGPTKKIAGIFEPDNITIFAKWMSPLGPSKAERLKSPAATIIIWAVSPHIPADTYKVVIRAVSRFLPTQPHFGRISPAQTSFLDYGRIRNWLQHCERKHVSCKDSGTDLPTKYFYVLDTHSNCLVEVDGPCRYVALSYVWGGVDQHTLTEDNLEMLKAPNGIQRSHLTTTIRDAIMFTEGLGERYLWVDALCIIQDSKTIRQQTLADMDRIYAQSLLTIVAGSCANAEDHLLGVSVQRTWKQWYRKIDPCLTLSAHIDFKDLLEDSVYSTRAWTFQEYQLANRLLIFASNSQVYFSCREAVYSEDVTEGSTLKMEPAMLQAANIVKVRPDPDRLLSTYRRAVEIYTTRMMSHQGDANDAFAGILKVLHNGRSVESIPVSLLDIALLWQPRESLRRRACFPSWSWVGWMGMIGYPEPDAFRNMRTGETTETQALSAWAAASTWIVWYSATGASCRSPAHRQNGPLRLHGLRPDNGIQNTRFPGLATNVTPTPAMLPDRLRQASEERPRDMRYLQFWTVSIHFQIELDTLAVLRYSSSFPENTGNGLRRFILRSSRAHECGWVMLDQAWIEITVKRKDALHEFILLSEAAHRDGIDGPQDGKRLGGCRSFNAMMIVWRDGIAERAGLGYVVADVREDAEWKEILLG